MKRTALLFLLLAAMARGDNAFNVDLTLHGGAANAPAQNANVKSGVARRIVVQNGVHVIFRGPVAGNFQIVGQQNGVVFQSIDTASPAAVTEVPTLRWKNGETLGGALADASESELTWKSPLFADPLQLRWDAIDRIDWPATTDEPKDPFGIALRDGSFIYGDITSIGADTISIRSARHGDAVLKRAEVLSIRRRENKRLVYGGPMGDLGWQAMVNQQDGSVVRGPDSADTVSPISSGPGGALLIRSWNRSAMLGVTLPPAVDVSFQLHSSRRPEFLLALGSNIQTSLRIETWDNVLVISGGDSFKIIRRIQDDERDLALRLCWDQAQHNICVFDSNGNELASWKTTDLEPQSQSGFIVQNRGLDLSLDSLRIRAWDGKMPGKGDPEKPHVELEDGRTISGTILGGSAAALDIQPSDLPAQSVSLQDIDAIVFSPAPPEVPVQASVLAFNDNTLIFGRIVAMNGNRASMATGFTSAPLSVEMSSPHQLLTSYIDFLSPRPAARAAAPAVATAVSPLDTLDQITINNTKLHGSFGASGDGTLGWMPVGAVKPVRPAPSADCEITRALPKNQPPSADPALFYLDSGDILPGALGSIDRTGAEFASSLMSPRKLPSAEIEAIEFSPSTHVDVRGFSDPAWQILKGDDSSVHRSGNSVTLEAGTQLGLPSLLQCGDFSFKYDTSRFSALRVRLFCAGKDTSSSTNILLCTSGAQFTAGRETIPGQFDNQYQVRTQPGSPVTVRFKVEDTAVELFVNDVSAGQYPFDPANCAGSGVILEPTSIWGNGTFTVGLSDFAAQAAVGRSWLPVVNADVRKQVLTVPRFAHDDPPRHLLLAANGDVLRGEIQSATDTHFDFRCGLENLNVPRDRVRAVIVLQPPTKDSAASADSAPPSAPGDQPPADPLRDRLQARANFRQIDLNGVLNFLRSQDPSLKIVSPDEANTRRVEAISVGNQTLSEALTEICAGFDLHYRLDPDNSVVLELPMTSAAEGLITKAYWLKPDALPATPPARDLLAAKGITFPKDASVDWRPQSGMLTMINSGTNQAKLASLLASDFGGSLGSPTHWIELAGGGELALAVDKFGPEFIEGHHPVYGTVKLPMAQVAVIRTSRPEPSAASRALENWRLVDAPEPVLPAGSSEDSPLLGKDAPIFTLPQLDGGNFDLATKKGHIVVLDFWATWCGPCIKALPGIIDLVSAFPADKVELVGVNQGEAPDQVKHFLASRGLKLNVAMDADQAVGRKYGVDAIPHTIIVGPDGKVAWEQTGYDPDGESGATEVIRKLLNLPPQAAPPATPSAQ